MLRNDSTRHRLPITITVLFCVLAVGCSQQPTLEVSQKFQQAEKSFADAETPEQFQRVAAMYQEILDAGFNSGVVHYNQGNAWMQAGQTGRAIAAYRQAKRQLPRDPYLNANLNKAKQRSGQMDGETVPLWNHIFFWQQRISYGEKLMALTAVLALVLILMVMTHVRRTRAVSRRLAMISLVPLLLIGISILRDWSDYEHTTHGVVIEETVARKGGSTTYDSAFKQPLQDGTEFVLLNRQADWLQIQIAENATGWIPDRAAVTY